MAVVEFKPDLKELIRLAAAAASEGKYVICVHNLSDAMKAAVSAEEKSAVYRCFSDMFVGIGNITMARNALFRACKEADRGGYYSIAYDKFLPYDNVVEDSDELPIPDGDTILGYNDVYNYFLTGQYDKGLDILCELPPDLKCLDEVIGVLYDAIEDGKKIDLTAHAYKLLLLAGIFSVRSGEFVRVMLHGCHVTRSLMTDGVKFFVDEIEDRRVLSSVAEAFVDEEEYECAEICFSKLLEECEIDETALFYMSALSYHKGNKNDGDKYWNAYKLVYERFGAPVGLFESMFERKIVPVYGTIAATFVKEDADLLIRGAREEWEIKRAAKNVLSYASDGTLLRTMKELDPREIVVAEAYEEVMISPYVSDSRKRRLMAELLKCGYEGRLAVAFENKGAIFDCIRFAVKSNRALWHTVFEKVSLGIICNEGFLPYRPSFLAAEIRFFAKKCAELKIEADYDDLSFLCTVMATHYNDKAKKDTNIGWVGGIVPPLSPEELKRGLNKFPPEVLGL